MATFIGGSIMMVGMVSVAIGGHKRQEQAVVKNPNEENLCDV